MKIIIITAFTAGILLPVVWKKAATSGEEEVDSEVVKVSNYQRGRGYGSRSRRMRIESRSPLELAESAIKLYSQSTDPKPWEKRQLQRLMFTLEIEHVTEILGMLSEVENPERFGEITRALYARWAELEPLAACEAAALTEGQGAEPLRGAMVTWLATDEAAALKWIAETKPPHSGLLKEWLMNYDQTKFAEAAKAVEMLLESWPEGADPLRRTLAERWVMEDWKAATTWIQTDENDRRRDSNLTRIARLRGEFHGLDALSITDALSSDAAKAKARQQIFYWWSFESPELAVRELAETGIPLDWTGKELKTFGNGTVGQHPEQLGSVLDLCRTEEQTASVCLGALENRVLKKPAALTLAAITLPDSSINTAEGKRILTRYYSKLSRSHPAAARQLYMDLSVAKQGVVSHLLPPE